MKNKQLYIMMGAPGSGKSTWVKKQLGVTDAYISRDEIRFAKLKDGEDYFEHEGEVFAEFVSKSVDALLDKKVTRVFVDASHLNAPSRAKILNGIYREMSFREKTEIFDVNVVWLKTSLKTCLERNANREGRANVPEGTIKSMWKSQTLPKDTEGIDRVYIVEEGAKALAIIDFKYDDGLIF